MTGRWSRWWRRWLAGAGWVLLVAVGLLVLGWFATLPPAGPSPLMPVRTDSGGAP